MDYLSAKFESEISKTKGLARFLFGPKFLLIRKLLGQALYLAKESEIKS